MSGVHNEDKLSEWGGKRGRVTPQGPSAKIESLEIAMANMSF